MAFDWKENWPIIAAGAVGLGGLYFLAQGSAGGTAVGQTSTQGASQVAQAYLAAQAQQEQSVAGAFSQYLNYLANKDNNQAYINLANIQALQAEYSSNAYYNSLAEQTNMLQQVYQQQIGATETQNIFSTFWNGLSSILPFFFSPKPPAPGAVPPPPPAGGSWGV